MGANLNSFVRKSVGEAKRNLGVVIIVKRHARAPRLVREAVDTFEHANHLCRLALVAQGWTGRTRASLPPAEYVGSHDSTTNSSEAA